MAHRRVLALLSSQFYQKPCPCNRLLAASPGGLRPSDPPTGASGANGLIGGGSLPSGPLPTGASGAPEAPVG
eukprot:7805169-Alexandrium_andersonii.AAC.1